MLSALTLAAGMALALQQAPAAGRTQVYYVSADEVSWNYLPGGRDEISGQKFADTAYFARTEPKVINPTYKKVLLREYTDEKFNRLKDRPAEWEHLGFLGPVLRASVGDTIRVVFRNNVKQPFSL